jgi:hypothetical protein
MPCPVKVNRHFRRTHHLHLQGWRIINNKPKYLDEAASSHSWRQRWCVPLKHQLTFTELYCVISQKIELFYFELFYFSFMQEMNCSCWILLIIPNKLLSRFVPFKSLERKYF